MFIKTDYGQATHFKIVNYALRQSQYQYLDDVDAIIKIEKKKDYLFSFRRVDGSLYSYWESDEFIFYKIVDVDAILEATEF